MNTVGEELDLMLILNTITVRMMPLLLMLVTLVLLLLSLWLNGCLPDLHIEREEERVWRREGGG